MRNRLFQYIARDVQCSIKQVEKTVALLKDGATVPFIARYRKEVTGGLTDVQLRTLEEKLQYWKDFLERRQVIIQKLKELNVWNATLEKQILAFQTKADLEFFYKPYQPKRISRASKARAAGLQPLAEAVLQKQNVSFRQLVCDFLARQSSPLTIQRACDGVRDILTERWSENKELHDQLVALYCKIATLQVTKKEGILDTSETEKYRDYFTYSESIAKIASHRLLAILRAQKEEILDIALLLGDEVRGLSPQVMRIFESVFLTKDLQNDYLSWLQNTFRWCWRVKLKGALENEILEQKFERAEDIAIQVFGQNLHDLLMLAPAGKKVILGLDPAYRTGVKMALIGTEGQVLYYGVCYPHTSVSGWERAKILLEKLYDQYHFALISIGNGTASRETEKLVAEWLKAHTKDEVYHTVVNEAGASVYSASELATEELPDMDVSYRGAVSIARRLQDPLAELVKIEPMAIGVGQYQHDLNTRRLKQKLNAVVEDCVNAVGVDVNRASPALLSYVAGIGPSRARAIVRHREIHGAFQSREDIKNVMGIGPKSFLQAAGFLRIVDGVNPLDASGVHPESYAVVQKIAQSLQMSLSRLVGTQKDLTHLSLQDFVTRKCGILTLKDILQELKKPGRDPRPSFQMAQHNPDITRITDLVVGMQLEGTVTNVSNFGAFVDIGLHDNGLVHISELSDQYVQDPRRVVRVGQIVSVRVVEIDIKRNRIGLSMRKERKKRKKQERQPQTTMHSALAQLKAKWG